MKILITGKPRAGKTTLIKRIYENLEDEKKKEIRGFFTEEIRERGDRVGFYVENFTGQRNIFAHVEIKSNLKVGRYGVDIECFEKIALPEIEEAIKENKILFVDEIGKMELFSERFKKLIKDALDKDLKFLGTVSISPLPFIKEIKQREDVKLYAINFLNRENLFKKIFKIIKEIF